ncbi:MAG: hypothetical protein LBS67_00440 [Clostridiales Family XIII bacterium]|nr:hypothetical protein [Clostridiales Family XIII bacterium]
MRLTFVTDDREYAAAFTEAVAATQRGFAVNVLEGAAPEAAPDDGVLIVDEDCEDLPCDAAADARRGAPGGSAVLRISAGGDAEPVLVDKYAGCSRICSEVKAAYAAARGAGNFSCAAGIRGASNFISFVGVDGGAGASSLALGLAAELSAYRGKKVLYLSFETVESPLLGMSGRVAARGDMSGFLFAFLREKENGDGATVSAALYTARDDYGVVRFPPFAGLNRLRELDATELGRFMGKVTEELAPDAVIADWGGVFGDAAAAYIGGSSFTVFVARHGGVKVSPDDGGASLLSLADELGVDRSRTVVVFNRTPAADDDYGDGRDDTADKKDNFLDICEDPYAFDRDAGRVSLSLATSFGTGVKRLADIVLGAYDEAASTSDDALSDVFTDAA